MKRSALLLAVFVAVPLVLSAQITITSSDVQMPVGTVLSMESTDFGPFTVDVGQTGGPRTWDLTAYDTPFIGSTEVVSVAGTPFAGDFPTANYCTEVSEDIEQGTVYTYSNIASDMWSWLGTGIELPDSSWIQEYDPPGQVPLPINMGSSWVFAQGWADTVQGIPFSYQSRSHDTVDAWGSLIIPMGTYDVLRIVSYDTSITAFGIPPFEFADTSTTIGYDWLSKELLFTANISSIEGETNPNFTTAESIDRASSGVGVEDADAETPERVPLVFRLDQNFPNPFNPQTEISFHVDESSRGQVELGIYSLRGSRVKTLVSRVMGPGSYTVTWDGRNDRGERLPSGLYFYRLTANGESLTRKMVLAK